MSAKNLKKLSLTLSNKNNSPEDSLPSPPPSPQQLPKHRSFKHGSQVIVFKGNYKGYIESVRKYHPATARINTYKYELIPYIPSAPLYVGQQLVSFTLPPATVTEINWVQVQHNNQVHYMPSYNISQFYEMQPTKHVQILELNQHEALIQDMNSQKQYEIPKKDIDPSKIQYVAKISVRDIAEGSFLQVRTDVQYAKIAIPQEFAINTKFLKKNHDDTYTITQGDFQNYNATIKQWIEPTVELIINHQRILVPVSNVYYLDLLLKNGNYFSIDSINPDGSLTGQEKNQNQIWHTTIGQHDIQCTLQGFSFLNEPHKDQDQDQHQENVDEILVADHIDDVEEKYVLTFKNIEHMQNQKLKLTKVQKAINDYVNKLLNIYNLQHYFDTYTIITDIEIHVQKIQQMLRAAGQNDFVGQEGLIFLVACNVLRLIVKLDKLAIFGQTKDVTSTYIDFLIRKGFIHHQHINHDNIFTLGSWSSEVHATTTPKTIIHNVWRLINTFEDQHLVFPTCSFHNFSNSIDIHPLVRRVREENIVKFATAKQLFEGRIPPTATNVFWGSQYTDIINHYKVMLENRVKTARNKNTKIVYQYVLDNFTRTPMAINELEKNISTDPLAQHKIEQLQTVFKLLMNKIAEHEMGRQEKSKLIQQQHEESLAKRHLCDTQKRLKVMSLDANDDYTPDIISPAVMEKRFLETIKRFKNIHAAVTKHTTNTTNYQTRIIKRMINDEDDYEGDYSAQYNDDYDE